MALNPGTKLSSYEIVSLIGTGGMGEVYRARDLKLGRDVAIKMLLKQLASSPDRLRRFEQEACSASALNHPNIITIHDIGKHGSTPYIAMEYVDGKTLREILDDGPVPTKKLLQLATQIADGLAKAHSAGIVHRDLKPENLMVTTDGFVKILDFGLAKLLSPSPPSEFDPESRTISREGTSAGVVLGTVGYMSPEQAKGGRADFRSDQFSFGTTLYEMITGKRAFQHDSAVQTLNAIIEKDPVPVADLNPDSVVPLRWIVERCLAKDPADRYASSRDLARELQNLRDHFYTSTEAVATPSSRAVTRRTKNRAVALMGVLAGLTALIFGLYKSGFQGQKLEQMGGRPHYLAIASFKNLSGDPESDYFSEGFTEAIMTRLMSLEGLHVVPKSDEIGAPLLLEGAVQKRGERVRVTYRLVQREGNTQLGGDVVDGGLEDIFAIQDNVAADIAERLRASLELRAMPASRPPPTTDVTAYSFYLQGRGYLRRYEKRENVDIALELFDKALQLDSQFALAEAGRCQAYWRKYEDTKQVEWVGQASEACQQALVLDDELAEVHTALGTIYRGTGKYDEAAEKFKRAISLDAKSDDAYRGLASVYEAQGRVEEAEKTYRLAIELRPDYWAGWSWLGTFYFRHGRYAESERQFLQVIELTPDNFIGYSSLGGIYHLMGRYPEAEAMLKKSLAIKPTSTGYTNLGTFYFFQGRYNDAFPMMENAVELEPDDYMLWGNLGDAYRWASGHEDQAPKAYRRAVELAQRELEVNPSAARVRGSLAVYLAKLEQREEAVTEIVRARRLAPANTNILFDSVLVYELTGDRENALRSLEQVLEKGYSAEEIRLAPELSELRKDPRWPSLIEKR